MEEAVNRSQHGRTPLIGNPCAIPFLPVQLGNGEILERKVDIFSTPIPLGVIVPYHLS
jgi:hypothetical protein